MNSKRSFWETAFLHPFLIAAYPLLALWATNLTQIPAFAISRAVFIILIFLAAALIFSLLVFRSRVKAALFVSLFMLLFLSYGHIFALVDMKALFGFVLGRHRFMIPLWFFLLGLGGFFLWRAKAVPYKLNLILNVVSLFLVILVIAQTLPVIARVGIALPKANTVQAKNGMAGKAQPVDGPDVYYILLDGYSRPDVLQKLGGPDVSGFEKDLTQLGFTVISCAQDNYDRTQLSLGSSLNMNYLDQLNIPLDPNEQHIRNEDFQPILKHSLIRQKFEDMGYQFVTFKTAYQWLDITDSDYYYDIEEATPFYNRLESVNFQYLFLSTTILRPVMEAQVAAPKAFEKLPLFLLQLVYPKASLFSTREYKQYQQNVYATEKLSQVPSLPGKKFVYAHLFLTHQPYVFNADGSFRYSPKDSKEAYFMQIEHANKRIVEVVKTILQDSKKPPVIIIQSDHGYPDTPDRVRIINAYYLPDGGAKDLYPQITPVNTFRLVLNRYFHGNYPLLDDKTFHVQANYPYRFLPEPHSCPSNAAQP